jgi:tetratricopeptide (TPR) repeat protein
MAKTKISYKRNGDKYYKEKNFHQALIWYNLGLQMNPHNYNLMISAANAYFKMLDTYRALPLYYRAIKKAKKIKTFQIIINKIQRGQIINYNLFTQRLHKTHKLMIEPSAIPFIISYIQNIQQIEKLEKKYERFKEIFEKNQ